VVGYNYKNVPFETTRLIEFLPDGFEHTVCVFCTHQKSKMTVTGGDTRVNIFFSIFHGKKKHEL
jgi:hypothetical protein